MVRTVSVLDSTSCDLGNANEFNYRTTKTIASASDYIDGIDCQTNTRKKFNQFYIQYKKSLQNRSPSQSEYMNSQKVTVWTVYPARWLLDSLMNEYIKINKSDSIGKKAVERSYSYHVLVRVVIADRGLLLVIHTSDWTVTFIYSLARRTFFIV